MVTGNILLPYSYERPSAWTEGYISVFESTRAEEHLENKWICVKPGVCQGRLIGGNLNTMEGFFGTEYMPEIKTGDILLIEDSLGK
jgi:muramoyltetrapeptide carboxypeptidase